MRALTAAVRLFIAAALVVVVGNVTAGAADVGKRVALIIGNAAYTSVPKLTNPINDAGDMAAMFKKIGFDVTHVDNVDASTFRKTLRDFEDQVIGSEIAVVYYAGHGMEVDGTNYLIPVDAQLKRDTAVEDEAISLNRVLAAIDKASKLRLVILDACRDNPFRAQMVTAGSKRAVGSRGLGRVEPSGSTLIAYSAKEGTTAEDGKGRNSPFAGALLKNLDVRGLEINFLFRNVRDDVISQTSNRQEPFVYGSLGATPIYFLPNPDTAPAPVATTTTTTNAPAMDMQAAYDRADRLNTVEGWDAFLQNCTGGLYCNLAAAAKKKLVDAQNSTSKLALVDPPPVNRPNPTQAPGDCDRLAAAPTDQDRPAGLNGVELAALQASPQAAIQACKQAATDKPSDRRIAFQYGRSLAAADRYTEAVPILERSADLGSAAAMNTLGLLHEKGTGYSADNAEALRWYRRSADLGNIEAMYNVGYFYEHGQGIKADPTEAKRWYDKSASGGFARGMVAVAQAYHDGSGTPKDLNQARFWYEKAAGIGNAEATRTLGWMYQNGDGVTRDYNQAMSWYQKAAATGDATAQASIGYLYDLGLGVPQDYVQARQWYDKGARGGDTDAMNNLAILFDNGRGGPADPAQARQWYLAAAKQGHVDAMVQVANFYDQGRGGAKDQTQARQWFEKATNAGSGAGAFGLASIYDNGKGVAADPVQARRYYQISADRGHVPGMAALATFFDNGRGGPQDDVQARKWYGAAAGGGDATSAYNFAVFLDDGRGGSKDVVQARKWYETSANQGNIDGMAMIGYIYDANSPAPGAKDDIQARRWYLEAANRGHIISAFNIGLMYANGRGGSTDYAQARRWYETATNGGDSSAPYFLGLLLQQGQGGSTDTVRAATLMALAVTRKDGTAIAAFKDPQTTVPLDARRQVQQMLIDKGFLTGTADGVIGPASRTALDKWAAAK